MDMHIGEKILKRKAELGIKTNVELADKMGRAVTPQTIGKWIAKKSVPRGRSIMLLTKALNISADFLLFDDSPAKENENLTSLVKEIVQSEISKQKEKPDDIFNQILSSSKIPAEAKQSLTLLAKSLLKLYGKDDKEE